MWVWGTQAAQPSGCSFWRLAAEIGCFYTEASDHLGCTIGAYTQGADLPPAKSEELTTMIGTMMKLSYLQEERKAEVLGS